MSGRKAEFLPLFGPLLFGKWEEEVAYFCPFAHFAASTARWFEVHPNEPGITMRQTFSFFGRGRDVTVTPPLFVALSVVAWPGRLTDGGGDVFVL